MSGADTTSTGGGSAPHVKVEVDDAAGTAVASTTGIRPVSELAKATGLNLDHYVVSHCDTQTWAGQRKGGDPVELGKTMIRLQRLPDPLIKPLKFPALKRRKPRRRRKPPECVLILPDSQNGYRWAEDCSLDPLHDRRCWDLAIQAAQILKPDTIVLLGDMLDLAPWSTRWPLSADLRHTTNPALAELNWWLRRLRRIAPNARILYLEGNHEDRLTRAMVSALPEAETLKVPGHTDRLLSVPTLLELSRLHIEYVGPYGARTWLWPDTPYAVRLYHGDQHAQGGGATVAKVLRKTSYSSIFGHVHRAEIARKAVHGPTGIRRLFALTPGTMARIDGTVPAATAEVDWHQGFGVLRRHGDTVLPQLIHIEEGRCVVNGRWIEARDRLPDIAAAWPDFRWAA